MKEKNDCQLPWLDRTYTTLKNILLCQGKCIRFTEKVPSFSQILLIGPGGCGKKTLVKKIASDCHFPLLIVNSSELSRQKPGESEELLKSKFKKADLLSQENKGICILLLRHLESMFRKPSRLLSELLNLLDSLVDYPGLAVIATVEKPYFLNEALRTTSRFQTEVYISVPSEEDRSKIVECIFKEVHISKELCSEISKLTPGYVLADFVLLYNIVFRELRRMKTFQLQREEDFLKLVKNSIIKVHRTSYGLPEIIPNSKCDIDQLGGLSEIKFALRKVITWPLTYGKAFKTLSIPQPSGVLLYGPPGCAKTSLVRAIASSQTTTFISTSAADLYSSYVGETERTISQLFQRARSAAPAILFIDEIDAIVGCRDGREKGAQERVLSSFLTEMDGIGIRMDLEPGMVQGNENVPCVVVIAATNRPSVLDSALLRPGRLDNLIYVPPPNICERLDILQKLTAKIPLGNNVNLQNIAERTELFSGADLCNLCREAALSALQEDGMCVEEVSMKHWENALQLTKPSLTRPQIDWYEQLTFS